MQSVGSALATLVSEAGMDDGKPTLQLSIGKIILIPSIITLVITIIRLVGELQQGPSLLFGREAGGGGALVGISWLPLILGPYFAVKLAKGDRGPRGVGRAIATAVAGLSLFFLASYLAFATTIAIPTRMTSGFALMIVAAAITLVGWPALAKTLVAYGYTARIPVVIIMYFAIRGSWGTHYDALPPGYTGPADVLAKWFFIGVLPQFIFWIVFTLVVGALLGTIAAALVRRKGVPLPAA